MIRKFFALLVLIALTIGVCVALTGCNQSASASEAPVSLDGTWVYTEDNVNFVAEIKDGAALINLRAGSMEGLYWSGTFAKTAADGTEFVSQANKDHLATSLVGSLDSSKTFTFKDGNLYFDFSMAGVKRHIELVKNSPSTN